MDYEHIATGSEPEFVDSAVQLLVDSISHHIMQYGSCTLGLSGGSTPKPIYEALGMADLPWNSLRVFLVDERYIPADSDDSNQKLVRDTLLKHAAIPEENLLFPDTSKPLEECIQNYETAVAMELSSGIPHIVTLGLGGDGHIASLFPPVAEAGFGDHLVVHTQTDEFAVQDRISTTMVVIGSADKKIFFLKGEEKKKTWEAMMNSKEDHHRWPAKAVLQLGNVTAVTQW